MTNYTNVCVCVDALLQSNNQPTQCQQSLYRETSDLMPPDDVHQHTSRSDCTPSMLLTTISCLTFIHWLLDSNSRCMNCSDCCQ